MVVILQQEGSLMSKTDCAYPRLVCLSHITFVKGYLTIITEGLNILGISSQTTRISTVQGQRSSFAHLHIDT